MGVIIIVISTAALSVFFVIQQATASNSDNSLAANTPPACVDNGTEPTLPAPDVYKPAGTVASLQTADLVVGSGTAAKAGDCLIVKYYGTLAADGTKFDENFTQPTAFAFTLGQGQVIPGWDQGLVGMKVGGTRRLVIPAALAYGSQGSGTIPPNADLVFVVKLLKIQ
jgi:FKBP-type peptidyl-prolyl cis-trans isomerase FkpA